MYSDQRHPDTYGYVKGKNFKEVRAKMKGDYKSDPDCRSGMLSNFKTNKNCLSLYLEQNEIEDNGIEELAGSLERNRTLGETGTCLHQSMPTLTHFHNPNH